MLGQICHIYLFAELSDPEARISSIKEALLTLPPAHYSTLKAIITHLGR